MKETDNAEQRRGWVLRLQLDAQGASRFDTVPVQIDMEGIPQRQRNVASPCWQRGDTDARLCTPD